LKRRADELINGVHVKELKVHCDERGKLFEVLRSDETLFSRFGQVYVTCCYPGVVKAWHLHKLQTDNLCVLCGTGKLVLYDPRPDSTTKGEINEFFPCDERRLLVQIPPGVHHGFKNIGTDELLVLNVPTQVYDYEHPDEYRLDPHDNDIPYDWSRKDG
jgi:dTDP-4-dehydrorhamnose 3,5-epimerase